MEIAEKKLSFWKGSEATASMVAEEIEKRWGAEAVKQYDPSKNCFTFNHWKAIGYKVKKGEKALRSVTVIEKEKEGQKTQKYFKSVCLFFINQVEKI